LLCHQQGVGEALSHLLVFDQPLREQEMLLLLLKMPGQSKLLEGPAKIRITSLSSVREGIHKRV